MAEFAGKSVLVTGGGAGIGAAAVRKFSREGARVFVTDVAVAAGESLVEAIRAQGGAARFLRLDVTDETEWRTCIEAIQSDAGGLDILVANAGIIVAAPVVSMSLEAWRRQNAVNLDGVFLSAKHCLPAMAGRGGSIVILSSVAGYQGSAGFAGYCASKGGVRLFAKALAMECCKDGSGIRVNTVHPGVVDTAIWDSLGTGRAAGPRPGVDPNQVARIDTPMGRAGTADEIADAILFLASDRASYITGTELLVDGGIMGGVNPRRRT